MQRLLVILLAALDAAIAAAVGLAVLLAPLTLLWTLAFGASAEWGALWPAAGTLWQFGHGAPIAVTLPSEVLVTVGLSPDAAAFTLSVTPLAFLLFTLFAAGRSGARAARSGGGFIGAGAGAVVFAAIAAAVTLTARLDPLAVSPLLGILLPTAVYSAGAFAAVIRNAWNEGDEGIVDRVHDLVDSWGDFQAVPGEIVRGAVVAVSALIAIGAVTFTVALIFRGGEVVALFERAHVDAFGVVVITLGHLAYLPTLLVWAVSWIAGPGFAVGVGTAVSPVGTEVGVIPGIPVLGLLPEGGSIWALVVVLLPVAAGALAGWMVRSRLVWEDTAVDWRPRAAIALGIPLLTAGIVALAAVLAAGAIGPGRLAETGPHPGWFALAIGVEVFVGAGILLLSPRNRDELAEERTDRWTARMGVSPLVDEPIAAPVVSDAEETAPIDADRSG